MDYNIRCSGPTYEAYRLYAVVMVFVYPVGVPLLYALHLHHARYALDPSPFRANRLMNGVVRRSRAPDQKIHRVFNPMGSDRDLAETRASAAARDANTDDAYGAAYARLMELWTRYGHLATAKAPVEEAILRRALVETVHDVPEFCASEKVDHLQFLFRPYSPECYYWEVCECARRLLLGAVLAVVRPNSSTQVAVGALGAALGSVAQAYARPYPPASKSLLSARPSPSRLIFAALARSIVFFYPTLLNDCPFDGHDNASAKTRRLFAGTARTRTTIWRPRQTRSCRARSSSRFCSGRTTGPSGAAASATGSPR